MDAVSVWVLSRVKKIHTSPRLKSSVTGMPVAVLAVFSQNLMTGLVCQRRRDEHLFNRMICALAILATLSLQEVKNVHMQFTSCL